MKAKREIGIEFGALAPPILDQLRAQGVRASILSSVDALKYQKDADAIVRLSVRGLLTDAEKKAARRRLLKALIGDLQAEAMKIE